MPAPPRTRRALLAILLTASAVPLLAWVVISVLASRAMRAAEAGAAARLGSAAAALAPFADQDDDEAARVVDELVRRLTQEAPEAWSEEDEAAETSSDDGDPGLGREGAPVAPLPAPPAFVDVEGELEQWIDATLASDEAEVAPPPARVRAFLDASAPTHDALVLHLLTGAVPHWSSRASQGPAGPLPPTHQGAQDVLLAAALERAREGHAAAALAVLDASWRMAEPLRSRHEASAQWVALGLLRRQLAALRHVKANWGSWLERIDALDLEPAARASLEWQAWCARHAAAQDDTTFLPGWSRPLAVLPAALARPFERPLFALHAAAAAEATAEGLADAHPSTSCGAGMAAAATTWNPLADRATTSARRLLALTARTALEADFARQVLEARRVAAEGGTPAASPPVKGCPGRTWTVVVARGLLVVSLEGGVAALPEGVPELPLFHAERLPEPDPEPPPAASIGP